MADDYQDDELYQPEEIPVELYVSCCSSCDSEHEGSPELCPGCGQDSLIDLITDTSLERYRSGERYADGNDPDEDDELAGMPASTGHYMMTQAPKTEAGKTRWKMWKIDVAEHEESRRQANDRQFLRLISRFGSFSLAQFHYQSSIKPSRPGSAFNPQGNTTT